MRHPENPVVTIKLTKKQMEYVKTQTPFGPSKRQIVGWLLNDGIKFRKRQEKESQNAG